MMMQIEKKKQRPVRGRAETEKTEENGRARSAASCGTRNRGS
jgi:hypothetical protein